MLNRFVEGVPQLYERIEKNSDEILGKYYEGDIF